MTSILQLKITLDGISPRIWRRFLVKDNINFEKLHETIQEVMGWENYHLFEFRIGAVHISGDEEDGNLAEGSFKTLFQSPEFIKILKKTKLKNGSAKLDVGELNKILEKENKKKKALTYNLKSKISTLLNSEKQKFVYVYDFGDDWYHSLVVEKILDPTTGTLVPTCLAGKRACPPEDCGSIPGYYQLMQLKQDKKHQEYKERIVEWLGESFDFERFNLTEVNKRLSRLVKVDGRTRYWVPK